MPRRFAVALAFLPVLGLAGCTTGSPPAEPRFTGAVRGDYAAIAACTYKRLEKLFPGVLNYADLRAEQTIKIAAVDTLNGPHRPWEATFKPRGAKETAIEIRALSGALSGEDYWVDKLMPEIKACEPH